MLLTSSLAQPIVDHIMSIARQNINIMDNRGVIIASGQQQRIGSFHQGAKAAIDGVRTIEIFPGDLVHYPGSLPGLNMPIILYGQVIGVVGISGHPNAVRDVARMVKMVTELILEQEVLQEEARSQFQLRENFAALLLSDHAASNYDKLRKTAKLLKYGLDLPRLVLAADLQPLLDQSPDHSGLSDLTVSRIKDNLLKTLSLSPLIAPQDLIVFLENRLIVFKHFEAQSRETAYKTWASGLQALLESGSPSLRLGMGSLVTDYTALGQSYQEALFALSVADPLLSPAGIYDFDILSLYLLKKVLTGESCQALESLKAKLTADFMQKYDMKNTIVSLLNNNMNITHTAKKLYIHRNTLLFRLKKFKERTGLDPCTVFNHAILCKMLVAD